VRPFGRFPERFGRLKRLFLGGDRRPATVRGTRPHQEHILLRLDSITDRTAAAELRGTYLYVPESEAVALPPGEYFVHQIVGLTVVTLGGETLGTIAEVLHTGSNDVYVVRDNGREILLPATKEVVREIDLEAQIMRVELLPGLLD
jgi:16S rRNA processing protein RimM